MQLTHSKLYCLCNRDIQNFIVCAIGTFKTLFFVQLRHSKLYCLCNRDNRSFIVCANELFETLLFACLFWGSVEHRCKMSSMSYVLQAIIYCIYQVQGNHGQAVALLYCTRRFFGSKNSPLEQNRISNHLSILIC